jgi:DNA mismatch repair protein MutL
VPTALTADEVAAVREWLERLALSHPECGFRLLSEGRQILNLKPESETDRVRSILADGDDFPVVTAANDLGLPDGHGLHVRVHWLQGLSTPQMRKLVQVVNGRAVRDRMLQQALLAPFRQALLPGQFPAVALFVEVDPSGLDVNVHPTKTEVRFLDSRRVFREIQRTVEDLIAREGAPAYASAQSSEARFYAPPAGALSPGAHSAATFSPGATSAANPLSETPGTFRYEPGFRASEPSAYSSSSGFDYTTSPVLPAQDGATGRGWMRPSDQTPLDFQSAIPSAHPLQGGKYAGALFNTYLLYENGPELILVDQHAAHERIRYEQLKRRAFGLKKDFSSQQLLLPEAVRFPAEERAHIMIARDLINEPRGDYHHRRGRDSRGCRHFFAIHDTGSRGDGRKSWLWKRVLRIEHLERALECPLPRQHACEGALIGHYFHDEECARFRTRMHDAHRTLRSDVA